MRHVVLNAMKLSPNCFGIDVARGGEVFMNSFELLHGPEAVKSETGHPDGIKKLGRESRPRVARNRHVIDLLEGQADLRQAVPDGIHGEARRILYTVEAFFLHRRD